MDESRNQDLLCEMFREDLGFGDLFCCIAGSPKIKEQLGEETTPEKVESFKASLAEYVRKQSPELVNRPGLVTEKDLSKIGKYLMQIGYDNAKDVLVSAAKSM